MPLAFIIGKIFDVIIYNSFGNICFLQGASSSASEKEKIRNENSLNRTEQSLRDKQREYDRTNNEHSDLGDNSDSESQDRQRERELGEELEVLSERIEQLKEFVQNLVE